MGRELRPTRTVARARVRPGDVVLIRPPFVAGTRWMLVDYVTKHVATPVWSGRWAFGANAGAWTAHAATSERYTVKDRRDAARDAQRLEALRSGA